MPTGNEYSDVRFSKDMSKDRGEGNLGSSGQYGYDGQLLNGDVPRDVYPNRWGYGYDAWNPQFTKDKEGDPQRAADEASGDAFYDLQNFLNNSPYTAGSRVCHELKEKGSPAHPSGGQAGPGDGKTGPA